MVNIKSMLESCVLCPRNCAIDRNLGPGGFCGAGKDIEVCASHPHFGEEPPISGTQGSGTIFFNHCNMRCVYCQNYRFSQLDHGKNFKIDGFVRLMFFLEQERAHNINLVTPTHYAAHIADAVPKARKMGLKIPIVYNTSGYEKLETLKMLDGLVEIYLADMRYGDNAPAAKFSSCGDYVEVNRAAVAEMYRQVGNLKLSKSGIAERGVIIRHLVLPRGLSGSKGVFKFISERLGKDTYISFMSQYYPAYKAKECKDIFRGINKREYDEALSALDRCGLKNGWVQQYMGGRMDPDFAGTNIEPDV